jgi:hypothetical protein
MDKSRATTDRIGAARLLLTALAWFTATAVPGAAGAVEPPARPGGATVEFDRFSARRERTADGDRLSISLLLRAAGDAPLACFVFVVARNDEDNPKVWTIWPPQLPGRAITAAGHFHGAEPSSGHALILTNEWQRVTATLPQTNASTRYDTAIVYVLTPEGKTLLARPFRL